MIVPMKRLTLIALKEDEARIMQALQAISAVQVIKTGDIDTDDGALGEAEARLQRFNGALSLLTPYAKKPSFMEPKPEVTLDVLHKKLDDATSISADIETADRRKAAVRAQIDKHNAQIELLEPWRALTIPLENIQATKSTALFAGRLRVEDLPRLDALDDTCAVELYGGEKERALLLLCPLDKKESVETLLKELEWTDMNFPKLPMSVSDAIAADKKQIDALKIEMDALDKKLLALGKSRAVIAEAADAAVIERDRAFARNLLEKTTYAFLLEGWIRVDEADKVEKTIQSVTDAYYMDMRDPAEDEIPPAVVQNGKMAKHYEAVTNLYSRPLPGSIDGTPFMTPWYFLLFGMMLSDTGYGLILALGCYFFRKKAKPRGMIGDLSYVIMMGGLSTIIWGVLIGTFFGFDWNLLFGTSGTFPLIVDPNTNPIMMLILCFGLGLVHIFCGVFIKIYMSFRDGDWQTAVFDNISWLMIIVGLLLFALVPSISTVGIVLALVGAAMVLFMKGRGKRNIAKRLVSGAGGLYNITGYLSDVLSYARLFALGIATGVIGSVFNSLVGMIMGASDMIILRILLCVLGAVLLVGLHLFNIGINTLGTFVHCARLQYVEFYGKFYEVGGREFMPLGYRTRHNRVM